MKRFLAIFLGGILISGLLPAGATPDGDDLPQVRPDGRRLMFGWHGGEPHKVDVSGLIRADILDNAHVLAAVRSGDIDYFVVSVSGPSSTGSVSAGGIESNLLWLKLKSWRLLDSQSMLYQSYWDSLEPIGEYHVMGGVLTLRYTNKRESTDYLLRYDSSHPEGKIALERATDFE
jgi:hypothetical protein